MPFTPAHPAIVLPFLRSNKRFVSATGLVIGSMAPDFEYFFKMRVTSMCSHTYWGLFYFDIPVTIFISLLFHQVIKSNLIENLPPFFQLRFNTLQQFDFWGYVRMHWAAFLVSAGLGSVSHLLWDSFTHEDGFFVTRLPFFSLTFPFYGARYPLFQGLQHFSTGVGLTAVMVYVILLKPDQSTNVRRPRFAYWGIAILMSFTILSIRFGLDRAALNLGNFIASSITAVGFALFVNGLLNFRQANA